MVYGNLSELKELEQTLSLHTITLLRFFRHKSKLGSKLTNLVRFSKFKGAFLNLHYMANFYDLQALFKLIACINCLNSLKS